MFLSPNPPGDAPLIHFTNKFIVHLPCACTDLGLADKTVSKTKVLVFVETLNLKGENTNE